MSTRKMLAMALVVFVLGGGAGLFIWQQQARRMEAEQARLRAASAELKALREENSRLTQTQLPPGELEKLRKAQSELLRLRDEASRLRQQLKEAQQAKRVPTVSPPVTAPTATDEEATGPVENFTATVRASLGSRQTLVTGGWTLPGGKRGLVFVQPVFGDSPDLAGQVLVQTRFVELPDEALAGAGLEGLRSGGKETSGNSILTPEQSAVLFKAFEESKDVNVLSAPTASTADGRQAWVRSITMRTIEGKTYELGPTLDVLPRISADGLSVSLEITAKLRLENSAPR